MNWRDKVNPQAIGWLLEEDELNAPIRFLALRDILDRKSGDTQLESARSQMMAIGPIPAILEKQHDDGYWVDRKSDYLPKYFSTVWQVIMLAQMGADGSYPRMQKACEYLLANNPAKGGQFSMNRSQSGTIHCLQGNLCAAMIDFGYQGDPRLKKALDWMVRSVTGEGFAKVGEKTSGDHYLRSGISSPGFSCSGNNYQNCAWGAVKVGLALSRIPQAERNQSESKAVEMCVNFLAGVDPANAAYPHPFAKAPSASWFKLGFPVFYVTDVLQNLEVLVALGLNSDSRLINAIELVLRKQDAEGRWPMEYTYNGKTWSEVEMKGQPSKWVTLRAIRLIKNFSGPQNSH